MFYECEEFFSYGLQSGKCISRPKRKQIVKAIQEALKLNRVRECLSAIGLSRKIYSQWPSEFFLCQNEMGRCDQRTPRQLTHDEIQTMRRLVTGKKYSHVPLNSLCLLAQRQRLLCCSIDSWYKYTRIFGWIRQRDWNSENRIRPGIRAQRPNEIWHVDVTQVKTLQDETVYVQTVYDNFSRYVVAWQATAKISGRSTVALLEKARIRMSENRTIDQSKIMMDGGPENDNHNVSKFIASKNLIRLLAQVDVHYSNSMVESLFRGLKSNFLNTEKLISQTDVEKAVDFYFSEHNEKIPRSHFKGATPRKKILGLWLESDIDNLKNGLRLASEHRKKVFAHRSCPACR